MTKKNKRGFGGAPDHNRLNGKIRASQLTNATEKNKKTRTRPVETAVGTYYTSVEKNTHILKFYSVNTDAGGKKNVLKNISYIYISLTEDEASIPCARAAESASDMAAAGADSPGLFDDAGVSSHEGTG